jgi:hypothetical protein
MHAQSPVASWLLMSTQMHQPAKLFLQKDQFSQMMFSLTLNMTTTRRIGRSVAMSVNDKEMTATFRIANTTAGTDALTEAMEGLRDGFSIELAVDNYEMQKDGTMKVLNGQLTAVALVTEPAVRSAESQR